MRPYHIEGIIVVNMLHRRLNGASALKGQKLEIELHMGKEISLFVYSSSIFRAPTLFLAMCSA